MGFSNCSYCTRIHNYEGALAHWNREPEPGRPGSSRREKWAGARPLDDARKWHYRIERGPAADYFDVCLYHTCMVRYHRPEENGDRRVDYTNDNRNLSHTFMWRMGFWPELKIGDVVVPVAYKELGTTIWTDVTGALLKEKSHHEPVYRRVSSPEQKAWRKQLKASTRNLATLFEMGIRVPEATASSWRHPGAPFKGVNIDWDTKQALRYFDGEMDENTTHATVEALREVWQDCLQFLVDKRDYGANAKAYSWHRQEVKEYKAPTPQEVTRRWYSALERICKTPSAGSERIEDWPASLPTNYRF